MPEGTVGTEVITAAISGLWQGGWPRRALWVCAVRERDGKRVVFGRDSHPSVADAVGASCAIPGFFRPVVIEGDAFVDGGVHSPTNADLLARGVVQGDADRGADLVIVSSPMSLAGRPIRLGIDQPARRWSRMLLDAEAVRLRRAGAHVIAFQPTPEDTTAMGANPMDPGRRAAVARQARESTLRRLERADTRRRLEAIIA
jgi:NTE family protein